ncbi:magnesium transporter MgtE N-terminal domain-containing protein [Cohnella faecalis]|uniref:MgtE protein n=1 Tax=Cohnella faecalis TaxID=2315694 RepID=A0A398CJ10_9BACL|nr:MgtE protein [Cohnella faecalis]RIE03286.1 MgtE protein [Cohnella faecalis]
MASADVEKNSYSGFERFLFFVTPVLFTAVLLGVLLLMFNKDWRESAMEIGNKIPVIKAIVPDPAEPEAAGATDEELTVSNARQKVDELKAQLTEQESSLTKATSESVTQKKTIEELNGKVEQLNKQIQEQTISTAQYDERIRSLAGMYGKMTPGKVAPILEAMTPEEAALVLGAMSETQRGRVLEKMSPQGAADVTQRIKDSKTVEDSQLQALQARVKQLEDEAKTLKTENKKLTEKAGLSAETLNADELNKTFSSMQAERAAKLLIAMAATNQSKALRILGVVDDSARSKILDAMSKEDSKLTSSLLGKLMPANP